MTTELQRARRATRARRARGTSMGTQAAGECRLRFRRDDHDASLPASADAAQSGPRGTPKHMRANARTSALQEAVHDRPLALARSLHDDLGQLIALAQMRLSQLSLMPLSAQASRLVAQLQALMAQSSTSLRRTCSSLVRGDARTFELVAGIEHHCRELAASFDQQIVFRCEGEHPTLPPAATAVVLRATRELVVNACKHAQADRIDACLICHAGELCVEVSDDGRGIATQASSGESTGFGLESIRHQLDALGAHLSIWAPLRGGTLCRLQLPLPLSTPINRHS